MFEVGDTVGTYKIVGTIGSGGMGEVFRVEHLVTKRVEAMKILLTEASGTPELGQRFLREIQLQASLSHPNIAAVHNAFWQDGNLIMIMELVEGHSLRSLLERGRLGLETSINYACQALAALDYAHAHGVTHRDISTSNMMVTYGGTVKLMDFGLAKSHNDARLTQTGAVIGSLYYAPPEQVQGRDSDARADIYSLGAVLFEMITGVKPFHSENVFTLMLAHVEQPPPRPSEIEPSLPPALDEILLKAMEKDPGKRFQSAALFGAALETVQAGGNPGDGAAHAWERIHEGSRRDAQQADAPALTPVEVIPAPLPVLRRIPARSRPAAIWSSRYLKVAAVLVFLLTIAYAWRSALSPASNKVPAAPDFASLPITWPKNLPLPALTYPAARPRASQARQKPRAEAEPAKKNHNVLVRAMSRIVHPHRGNSDQQPNN